MSFIERFLLLCPLFGVSFIGGSTVFCKRAGKTSIYIYISKVQM